MSNRTMVIARKEKPGPTEDWFNRLASLLSELPGTYQSYTFKGAVNQGGISSFEFVNKVK